jgi:hypothetical protein
MQELEVFGTDERKQRALILDAKLNDALLDTFIISAELVDEKLYKELGYETAREYFENKSITIGQAYKYARIGREIKPLLAKGNPSSAAAFANIGVLKLDEIVRHASDQIPALMQGETIVLGDEEYTAEELQEVSDVNLTEKLRKLSKKVEKNELLEEQNKTLSLEKKTLEKELTEFKRRDEKYREYSVQFDEIDTDIREAFAALETVMKKITRIQSEQAPESLQLRLVNLIDSIQRGGERAAEMHQEVLLIHLDPIA